MGFVCGDQNVGVQDNPHEVEGLFAHLVDEPVHAFLRADAGIYCRAVSVHSRTAASGDLTRSVIRRWVQWSFGKRQQVTIRSQSRHSVSTACGDTFR
jgi:hypothetical protein